MEDAGSAQGALRDQFYPRCCNWCLRTRWHIIHMLIPRGRNARTYQLLCENIFESHERKVRVQLIPQDARLTSWGGDQVDWTISVVNDAEGREYPNHSLNFRSQLMSPSRTLLHKSNTIEILASFQCYLVLSFKDFIRVLFQGGVHGFFRPAFTFLCLFLCIYLRTK